MPSTSAEKENLIKMFDGDLRKRKIIETLETYKGLTADFKNHWHIIQDQTILLYTSTLLDCNDVKILNICLDILEDFISNEANHEELVGTLGIFESLESLSIRSRNQTESLAERCGALADILRKSAPPAYGTRTRRNYAATNGSKAAWKNKLYQVYIEDLNEKAIANRSQELNQRNVLRKLNSDLLIGDYAMRNKENVERVNQALGATKGIISFITDKEKRRFTIRITPKLSLETIAIRVKKNCGLTVFAVKRNLFDNKEILIDLLNPNMNLSHHYFPEEDNEVIDKEKAIKLNFNHTFARNAGEWIKSAYDFWSKSVY